MDKNQLGSSIWRAANEMRGSLDANDYKDFILGFIFYKFLSDKQTDFFVSWQLPEEQLPGLLTQGDNLYAEMAQKNIGYYIAYEDLFDHWLHKDTDLVVSDVTEAMSRFESNIAAPYKHVYGGIFETFRNSVTKLGADANQRAKKLREIMRIVRDVPTDNSLDYDVLGYIYEYLIGQFAANAGKKNGEFYTPHTVALVMAEIVGEHLRGRAEIEVYDPTSGSASLMLNIGSAIERRSGDKGKIKYYAQELKQDAYNLTRMNLVMRGVAPSNIVTRNADSLGQDWPMIDEYGSTDPLFVDAVVSNPPYSAKWDKDAAERSSDVRFAKYGYAPKSKADYAFLLHELYHLRDDGILTIVLPHGVLFRGGEESEIRKRLIDQNNIETIIGFPPNIFFGTGIATIVMVLKKKRGNDDTVQFVDASKGFVKDGTKNELRPRDVRKIVDTVLAREDVEKYSRVVSREEIIVSDYNLNIPRYVDSSEEPERWDIYSTMFGGIPFTEIDQLAEYWDNLPELRDAIFEEMSATHAQFREGVDIADVVTGHHSVSGYTDSFDAAFEGFDDYLHEKLIDDATDVEIRLAEGEIRRELFARLDGVPIVDDYGVYQLFADQWNIIEGDLGVIQLDGWEQVRGVEPNMVTRKKDGKDVEAHEGWKGTILPFALVQSQLLPDAYATLHGLQETQAAAEARKDELFEEIPEEEHGVDDYCITNAAGTDFRRAGVTNRLNQLLEDVTSPEIKAMESYLDMTPSQKRQMEADHPEYGWDEMEKSSARNKGGEFGKPATVKRIVELKKQVEFEEGSITTQLVEADSLLAEIAEHKKDIKAREEEIHKQTRALIPTLDDAQVSELLHAKWITPLMAQISAVPGRLIEALLEKLCSLQRKYATTLTDVNEQIDDTSAELAQMMDQLKGNDTDMRGIEALADTLGGK
ncbi:type I restriction-modification system subunit M [Corynebacterium halotolerans]|uniref:site-specific DNA-methyltransferase (adenine-specific) n=1 Tax=Corynebacterium halotolerans YIM 70093 = DSM 44683 TaxID=1121362 RepID=M1NJZ0_9CORY|nr:type I restriction-modification system subunit M [Corynebacterium halotolerans]AGF71723.1 type I restriction-modification system, M subunit [Corynebacterium halotolerans YIM 70093 = DSM 44683]